MSGLEKLQDIGAQKIFEQTHIAKKYVEDILAQEFSSMNKIQFSGFISILEREYSIDLHELLDAYAASFASGDEKAKEPFVVSEQENDSVKSTNKGAYVVVALLVAGAIFMLFRPESKPKEVKTPVKDDVVKMSVVENELNNSTIEEAKLNLTNLDTTLEKSHSQEPEEEKVVEPVHTSKFEIQPRSKLWIGIVDLDTFKRSQKMSAQSFTLNPDKEWLLVMGHGYVNFEVNGENFAYKDENKVWFGYENGKLSKLTRSEFKEKNRGKAW